MPLASTPSRITYLQSKTPSKIMMLIPNGQKYLSSLGELHRNEDGYWLFHPRRTLGNELGFPAWMLEEIAQKITELNPKAKF